MYALNQRLTAIRTTIWNRLGVPAAYLLLSMIMTVVLIPALPSGSPLAADAEIANGYVLGSGDRLRVRVHEWPGFDGDIDVGSDGQVGLPIIGSVNASGLTVGKLAEEIAERLRVSSNLSNPPSVVVSIVRHRPFFVLGDVVRPGQYEFQPGLTVLKAVSIAGGYFRPREAASAREIISARSELESSVRRVHRELVRISRIKAELAGRDDFDIPKQLVRYSVGSGIETMIERERGILAANLELHQKKIATFEGLSKITEQEIESLQKELGAVADQLKIVEKEAKRVRHLASRGLTNADRVTAVELSLSRIERTRQELQTAIIRSRLALHREQRRAEELKAEAQKALQEERVAALARLKEARVLQRRSEQLLLAAEVGPSTGLPQRNKEQLQRKFTLVRKTDIGTEELEAKAYDAVEPGDVINVEKPVPVTGVPDDVSALQSSRTQSALDANNTETTKN